MLLLLSPAKTLDYETPVRAVVARRATHPLFTARAAQLIDILRRHTAPEIGALMQLSDRLAELNVSRYAAWQPQATGQNSRPAVLAFNGDVYGGLAATSLDTAALDWAQQHLVILSGLYGALRPLDRLQPYRLEMGTAVPNPRGRNLYDFWGDTIAEYLNERLAGERRPVVVNLASQEYARVALRPALKARVLHCQFEEGKGGRFGVVGVLAKRARGLMARWAIDRRVRAPQALQGFDLEGYAFAPAVSDADRWVFRRTIAA